MDRSGKIVRYKEGQACVHICTMLCSKERARGLEKKICKETDEEVDLERRRSQDSIKKQGEVGGRHTAVWYRKEKG